MVELLYAKVAQTALSHAALLIESHLRRSVIATVERAFVIVFHHEAISMSRPIGVLWQILISIFFQLE
jgi:hypothetical protein